MNVSLLNSPEFIIILLYVRTVLVIALHYSEMIAFVAPLVGFIIIHIIAGMFTYPPPPKIPPLFLIFLLFVL
jgi:hypothetical protein